MSHDAATMLSRLARRWRRRYLVVAGMRALALGLPLLALGRIIPGPAARLTVLLAMVVVAVPLIRAGRRVRRVGAADVARHLDRTVPAIQESAELLLRDPAMLDPLAALQRRRALAALADLAEADLLPDRRPGRAAASLAVSAGLAGLVAFAVPPPSWPAAAPPLSASVPAAAAAAPAAPVVQVRIAPPSYTGVAPRLAEGLDVAAEEGSQLAWSIRPGASVTGGALIFESAALPLQPGPGGDWVASRRVAAPDIYRLRLDYDDGETFHSRHARIAVQADRPPALRIESPAARVEVDPQAPQAVPLVVEARDDYGLGRVRLVATLASGSGELVKFRERTLDLTGPDDGPATERRLQRTLDPADLGMVPGVELYYYVEAEDNRRPVPNRTRSAAQRIVMPGGAGPSVALPAGLPVLRLPEFFRSQRQIILDTEKLLEERERLTRQELGRRSEGLGFDQRALRMRYGGLLGEEFVSGSAVGDTGEEGGRWGAVGGDEAEEGAHPGALADAGLEGLLPEGMVHEHDSAESATFFETRVRRTLKAALQEMWDAEGPLRVHQPDLALPHEYRALYLLKQAQESSRLYVQRIGFRPPPLYPDEKRLSGDLSGIEAQRDERGAVPRAAGEELRHALALLSERPRGFVLSGPEETAVLGEARRVLADRARAGDDVDLVALDVLDALLAGEAGPVPDGDREALERALWRALPPPGPRPGDRTAAAGPLYDAYRQHLKKVP